MPLFSPPNIEQMKAKRDITGLIKALGYQKDKSVRMSATMALGQIGDARAVDSLIAALKDENSNVRGNIADALGKIGDKRAVVPLIFALKDKDYGVRRAAVDALGKIGQPAVEPLLVILRGNLKDGMEHARAMQAGISLWDCRRFSLRLITKDIRIGAAEALGHIGDPRAVESLFAALKNKWEGLRRASIEALGKIGDSRAIVLLITVLTDKEYDMDKECDTRVAAARILGEIGNAQAVEPLIFALKNDGIRKCARLPQNHWVRLAIYELWNRLLLLYRTRCSMYVGLLPWH